MIGFQWDCPWRIEWKRPFEWWYRTQFGPFYYLHPRDHAADPRIADDEAWDDDQDA